MAPLKTRAEINFIRLLTRCEELAGSDSADNWKLVNYVGALEEKLSSLKKLGSNEQPASDVLNEYSKKVDFLKNFTKAHNYSAVSTATRASAQIQIPSSSMVKSVPSDMDYPIGKQIQVKASSRIGLSMREELMLTEKEQSSGLRQRATQSHDQGMKDASEFLKHHQKMHEQIAGEMLDLTRSLKHNIVAAKKVIQDDLEVLTKSNEQTDSNLGNLKNASTRLEGHLQKGTNWWLWICLALVCVVFLFMIFFIRFFPKR